MTESRHQFWWRRPDSGFRWVDAREAQNRPASRYLVTVDVDDDQTLYKPLEEHSGLCVSFARLESAESTILAFANQYGRLGAGAERVRIDGDDRGLTYWGESFEQWVDEIEQLREVIELHELVTRGDVRKLKSIIKWTMHEVRYQTKSHRAVIASRGDSTFDELEHGDPVRTASVFLARRANEKLRPNAQPGVMVGDDRNLGLYFVPNNLLGALWLQFTLALTTGARYAECAWCGRPFEVGPRGARSDRKTCSDRCRVALNRDKRKGDDHA